MFQYSKAREKSRHHYVDQQGKACIYSLALFACGVIIEKQKKEVKESRGTFECFWSKVENWKAIHATTGPRI